MAPRSREPWSAGARYRTECKRARAQLPAETAWFAASSPQP